MTSDVDLLIIREESVERYTRGDIASYLDEEIDVVRTDVIFYSREVFERSNNLLMDKVRNEGVIINYKL